MRFHPEIVARAVLSSVEPLNNGFDMPSHIFAALQRIAYDADRDTGLAPWLPKGGMTEAVRALQRRIAAGPIRVSVRDDAGKTQTVVLGAEDLQLALLAHTDEAEHWPAFILSLYYGHCDAWGRQTIEDRSAGPVKLIGPLADSSLGVSTDREHQMRTDPAVDLLGSWNFESNLVSAPDWPTPDMGDAVRLPRDLDSYRLRLWRLGHLDSGGEYARPATLFPQRPCHPCTAPGMTAPSTNYGRAPLPSRRSMISCGRTRRAACPPMRRWPLPNSKCLPSRHRNHEIGPNSNELSRSQSLAGASLWYAAAIQILASEGLS